MSKPKPPRRMAWMRWSRKISSSWGRERRQMCQRLPARLLCRIPHMECRAWRTCTSSTSKTTSRSHNFSPLFRSNLQMTWNALRISTKLPAVSTTLLLQATFNSRRRKPSKPPLKSSYQNLCSQRTSQKNLWPPSSEETQGTSVRSNSATSSCSKN